MTVDPITIEVVRGSLDTIAEEMELILLRSSHSTIINEALDATSTVYDARGRTIAQAVSLPVHLGVLVGVGRLLAAHFPEGEARPGDLYLFNDPYAGGTHLPDIALAAPVFTSDTLAGYVATMSHHADVGGAAPGSVTVDARDHFAEGLRIPLVRLAAGGVVNEDLMALLEANTRDPDALVGDLSAQIAACRTGSKRFGAVVDRWGPDVVTTATDVLLDRAEALIRAEIQEIPDGTYSFTDWLDDDGTDPRSDPVPITVAVTVDGSDIHFDFTGTAPQTTSAINNVPSSAMAACYFIVRSLATDVTPNNDGCYRPITATLPLGTIVNPRLPAPVGARSVALARIGSAVHGAMARAAPERFNAGNCGQTSLLMVGGYDPGTERTFTGVIGGPWFGGLGGRPGKDGIDVTDQDLSNVYHVPIEATEALLPIRFDYLRLWQDSGGAGTWRGGLGFEAEIEWLRGHGLVSLRRDRHRTVPWGVAGGADGPRSRTVVQRADGTIEELAGKGMVRLEAGDRLRLWTTGSGGYGPPHERDPQRVLDDVLDGRVSRDAARDVYGVVLTDDSVEEAATAALRSTR